MKLNVEKIVLKRNGKPAVREEAVLDSRGMPIKGDDGVVKTEFQPVTYRDSITQILDIVEQGDTGEVKAQMKRVLDKIWRSKEADLTLQERGLIIQRAEKFANTFTYGILVDFLEEPSKDKDKEKDEDKETDS